MSCSIRNFTFSSGDERWPELPALLLYTSNLPPRPVSLGPFQHEFVLNAHLPSVVRGLIVLSHGTGGSQVLHLGTAAALAEAGFLVAAIEHGGDNYRDDAMLSAADYFLARPQQIRALIHALREHPDFSVLLRDVPVGVIGHSAGGCTALTLAGAQPDLVRLLRYYRGEEGEDSPGSHILPQQAAILQTHRLAGLKAYTIDEHEPLVTAVVALAPVAMLFDAASLARLDMPVKVLAAEHDTVLPNGLHASYLAQHLAPGAVEFVAHAGHFAFITQCDQPLPCPAGDAAENPSGFDRPAYLLQMNADLIAFFETAWHLGHRYV